jgi:hypothetical protein
MTHNHTFIISTDIIETATASREAYLAYRAEWKQKYKELSEEIRALKAVCRAGGDVAAEQSKMHYLAIRATRSLVELAEVKKTIREERAKLHVLVAKYGVPIRAREVEAS